MTIDQTRELYIRRGAMKVSDKLSDAVAYLYASHVGKPCAAVFYGKQSKPIARYQYRDEAERAQRVKHWFDARRETLASKAKAAAKRKAFQHSYKVGDLFRSSWGYDQTNIDYYQVVEVRGANLVLRKIGQDTTNNTSMSGHCVPMVGEFIGEAFTKRAQDGFVKIASYANAYYVAPTVVAGVPVYERSSWSSWA